MSSAMPNRDDLETRRRRALYRAQHRGTKEMDWMLGRYVEAKVAGFDAVELTRIERLLAVSDVDLHGWLIDPSALVDTEFAATIDDIRAFHDLSKTAE